MFMKENLEAIAAKCHNEKGFSSLKTMEFFDHNTRPTSLLKENTSRWIAKNAMQEKTTKAIDFSRCSNCHKDYHEGEFKTEWSLSRLQYLS